jgi:hypothetical protein
VRQPRKTYKDVMRGHLGVDELEGHQVVEVVRLEDDHLVASIADGHRHAQERWKQAYPCTHGQR